MELIEQNKIEQNKIEQTKIDKDDPNVRYLYRLTYTKKDGTQTAYRQKYRVKNEKVGRKREPITDIKDLYKTFDKSQQKLILNCAKNIQQIQQLKEKAALASTFNEQKDEKISVNEYYLILTDILNMFKDL
jgi:hypothetical protein